MCDGVITDLADFPFPTCSTHLSLVTDYPDFLSWSWDSMYLPHGPVHSWIGGVVNCEDTVNRLTNLIGKENTDSLGLYEFDQRKGFWIDGYFECDGSAPDSASEEDVGINVCVSVCSLWSLLKPKSSFSTGQQRSCV